MKEQEIQVSAGYIHHIVGVMKERFGEDAIVLFHVADNYECFLEDSTLVSGVLETARALPRRKRGNYSCYTIPRR